MEILYLGGNRLSQVPATLGRLTKLTALVLADNSLTTIPPTFEDLRALKSLTLHNNQIKVSFILKINKYRLFTIVQCFLI